MNSPPWGLMAWQFGIDSVWARWGKLDSTTVLNAKRFFPSHMFGIGR